MSLDKKREALDASLTPFKHWDIIANVEWDLIWVFDKVAYHWWRPDIDVLWNYIFADFTKAISKWWEDWHVFENWCWDDGCYIDRRKYDLSKNYRPAMKTQIDLFKTLISKSNSN